jgi:hypothetical protein
MNPPPATATSMVPSADDATAVQLFDMPSGVQAKPEFTDV